MEKNAHPMFQHVEATAAQKVEILASNPYRYYLAPNLWIGRNNSRIVELDTLSKAVELAENQAIQARIIEVKKQLQEIYSKNV
ncbi:MAG: hypothetical protein FGM16_03990 [Flavobacterium sp.]|nr:hypothetical protein [Flavobacterium sp.]